MCRPAPCPHCSKTTWAGCGQHVDQVMRSVPAGQRCTCDRQKAASVAAARPGLLSRLLGRS